MITQGSGYDSSINLSEAFPLAILKTNSQSKLDESQWTYNDTVTGKTYTAVNGVVDLRADNQLQVNTNLLDDSVILFKDRPSTTSDGGAIQGDIEIKGDATIDHTVTAEDLDVSSDSGTIAIDLDSETFTIAGGTGITTSATSNTLTITSAITAGDGLTLNTADIDIDAAQTTITSILATDLNIGEDDQTKIDFETADTINFYAGNEKQLILTDGAINPGSNAIVE